jgi:hypothetical protein
MEKEVIEMLAKNGVSKYVRALLMVLGIRTLDDFKFLDSNDLMDSGTDLNTIQSRKFVATLKKLATMTMPSIRRE